MNLGAVKVSLPVVLALDQNSGNRVVVGRFPLSTNSGCVRVNANRQLFDYYKNEMEEVRYLAGNQHYTKLNSAAWQRLVLLE